MRRALVGFAAADAVYRWGGPRSALRVRLGMDAGNGLRAAGGKVLALLVTREELTMAAALARPRGGEQR